MQINLRKFNVPFFILIKGIVIFLNQGCSVLTGTSEIFIEEGYYDIRNHEITEGKIYVEDLKDSIMIYLINLEDVPDVFDKEVIQDTIVLPGKVAANEYRSISFSKVSFDLDLLTFLFKYRPSQINFPRQLNAEPNGVIFTGYRTDIFTVDYVPSVPGSVRQSVNHTGFSFGVFTGFGSALMNPWVTSSKIDKEYDGMVWSNGVASLLAVQNISIAMGIGFDFLLDGNRDVWIYQNKPWLGFAVGINLN